MLPSFINFRRAKTRSAQRHRKVSYCRIHPAPETFSLRQFVLRSSSTAQNQTGTRIALSNRWENQ
jgi:hypothetical protein